MNLSTNTFQYFSNLKAQWENAEGVTLDSDELAFKTTSWLLGQGVILSMLADLENGLNHVTDWLLDRSDWVKDYTKTLVAEIPQAWGNVKQQVMATRLSF